MTVRPSRADLKGNGRCQEAQFTGCLSLQIHRQVAIYLWSQAETLQGLSEEIDIERQEPGLAHALKETIALQESSGHGLQPVFLKFDQQKMDAPMEWGRTSGRPGCHAVEQHSGQTVRIGFSRTGYSIFHMKEEVELQ